MTEGQLRFQSLMEDQRHNLALERFESEKAKAQTTQAEAASKQADVAVINAVTRQKELEQTKTQMGWDIGFKFASFLFPDANTALKSGAQFVSSLFS